MFFHKNDSIFGYLSLKDINTLTKQLILFIYEIELRRIIISREFTHFVY